MVQVITRASQEMVKRGTAELSLVLGDGRTDRRLAAGYNQLCRVGLCDSNHLRIYLFTPP